jgi:hypothetical protein
VKVNEDAKISEMKHSLKQDFKNNSQSLNLQSSNILLFDESE